MKIRVGSRESRLAIAQAELVIAAIKRYAPSVQTELITMKTTGDIILDRALDKIGGKGLFVKELDRALLDGQVDITVHSLKDMPMAENGSLPIVAVSVREDPRDALVLPISAMENDVNFSKPIGCSSARRSLQLREIFPKCSVAPIRGNVLTRLEKLDSGEFSAITLAVAGLKRLGLEGRISRIFSTAEMLPAAGQGVIAVQARAGFDTEFLADFNNEAAFSAAVAERSFVRTLDGGCSSPVAAYAEVMGENITITGLYVDENGGVHKGTATGLAKDGAALGQGLAERLRGEI